MRSLLTFHGRGRGKAWNCQLLAAIKAIVDERKHELNLRKLHSISVGFDLNDMLRSVDTSLESSVAFMRRRDKKARTGAAGCMVAVMHDNRYVRQIFLDATHLVDLIDQPHQASCAANIIAHELAHVDLDDWQTQPPLSCLADALHPNWRYKVLRYLTMNFWDEYAACRMSVRYGDPVAVARNFAGCLRSNTTELPKLKLYTRKHWRTLRAAKTFGEAINAAREPLRSASYLMGHLDGLGCPLSVEELCPSARGSPLATCWPKLHQELRLMWQGYNPDFKFDMLDGLAPVLMEAIRICGGERMLVGMTL